MTVRSRAAMGPRGPIRLIGPLGPIAAHKRTVIESNRDALVSISFKSSANIVCKISPIVTYHLLERCGKQLLVCSVLFIAAAYRTG